MSSFLLSHDSDLMMLEIAVENLFVPWTTEFDKVILKKTIVMFRMLDKDWTSLSPNRRDYRPYQGSNCENEKFYGGRSVVFSVPTDFFEKKASGIDVQLYVQKQVCEYFETVSRQRTGSAAVSVDNLLNGIAKQVRERNELAEHLSDFYKRQIISRSMVGTYTLLDENFRNTAATISLYIRLSYIGKCLVTEITQIESILGAFYTRGDSDERQPYFSRQLTSKELQDGCWDDGSPRVPHGRLICRCEELVKKEAADLAMTRETAAAVAAIATPIAAADGATTIAMRPTTNNWMQLQVTLICILITVTEVAEDTDIIKKWKDLADADSAAITVAKVGEDAAAIDANAIKIESRETPADYGVLADDIHKRGLITLIDSSIEGEADAAATAKTKRHPIKDNGGRTFRKAAAALASSELKRGGNATIGITERGKRIPPSSSPPFSCQQTYPLCCQLQPHLTCFTDCFDVSPCYCYCWIARPFQFSYCS